jgi:RNA polymerase sigma-70 factor (ECF subfamily)
MKHAEAGAKVVSVEDRSRALHASGQSREAFTLLVEEYGPEIIGYLTAVLKSEAEAREVWSETAARLWQGFAGFEWRSSFRTWAYAVASNAFRRWLRTIATRRERPLDSDLDISVRARTETRPHQKSEIKVRIARLREQLSEEDNALLILRVDRDFSWNDIALTTFDGDPRIDPRALEKRSAMLRKRFERIVERLRCLAEREGILP